MTRRTTLTVALSVASASLLVAHTFAQNDVPRLPAGAEDIKPASVQAPLDPDYQALVAMCKTPPPGRGRGPAGGGRGPAAGRGPAPQGVREYSITEIPGVIKAGQKWTFVWQQAGNNGDGIVGTDDGSLLLAQNDSSAILKLDKNGKPADPSPSTRRARCSSPSAACISGSSKFCRSGKCSPTPSTASRSIASAA